MTHHPRQPPEVDEMHIVRSTYLRNLDGAVFVRGHTFAHAAVRATAAAKHDE